MHKISYFTLLLFCLASCNKGQLALNDHEQYKRASAEIESGKTYAYYKGDVSGANDILSVTSTKELNSEEVVTPEVVEVHKNIRQGNYSSYKICKDTTQDDENYQRKNRIPNRNANTAFVLGLLAFIPIPLVGILGLVAMGFGIKALVEMKQQPLRYKGKGKAIFGVTVGAILLIALLILIAAVALGYL